mmetsp:Transcript_18213/g.41502  ORF Transcript_18213/g.41502 Transcript_18213/m.41502 type:complete len:260 (+) Transcript_18213:78-857(+)
MTLVYITKARRCAISYAPKSVGNTRSVTTKCFYSAENVRDLSLAASNLKMCKSSSDLRREYSHSFSKATFSRRGNFRKGGTFPQLQTRNMFIQTATTPNPESVKFVPGHPVFVPEALTADNDEEGEYQEENAGYFVSRDESTYRDDVARSPLARRIFDEDPGVRAVYLGRDFVTVTKYVKESWSELQPSILTAIMDHYDSGELAVTSTPLITDTTILDDDDEVVAMIKELLEQRIRPAVQDDGGDIRYVYFDEHSGIVT